MSEISVSKSVPPFACCLPIDKQINKQTDKTQNVDVKVVMSTSHMQSVSVSHPAVMSTVNYARQWSLTPWGKTTCFPCCQLCRE